MFHVRSRRWLAGSLLWGMLAAASAAQAANLPATVSWVGNTYGGGKSWVLQDVQDIFVDDAGSLFTNISWDEAGGNVQEYKEGKLSHIAYHTHGWGYEGGDAVAANSKYLFIAQTVSNEGGGLEGNSWPAKGFTWTGVSRRLRTDITKPASFAGGHGKEGDVLPSAFLPVAQIPERKAGAIRGLWATDTRLFVSSPFDNSIKVYDPETMQLLTSWPVDRPDKICLDRLGHLWVLQKPQSTGTWKALCFTAEGKLLPQRIEFAKEMVPTDLCTDSHNRLLIADAGPDQQIKIYDNLDQAPALKSTLGVKGGILASPIPGQFGDLRFNNPTGVGADAQGNLYVASSGSSALETGGGG
ncbi:MAG TPA: hypothetical protein VHP11_09240, partial [Tepidisphaeraceae bacterium]|nr:hypothetical protein [Tepidisphaeraceae bacterium]